MDVMSTESVLVEVVSILDREKAADDDLVWYDQLCFHRTPQPDGSTTLTADGTYGRLNEHVSNHLVALQTLWRARTIIIWSEDLLERGWILVELIIGAYCQRLLYSKGPGYENVESLIQDVINPVRLSDPRGLIDSAKFSKDL